MSGFADLFNTVVSHQKAAARESAARDNFVTDVGELLEAIASQYERRELARAAVTSLQLACVIARQANWDASKASKECLGMWGRTSFIEPVEPATLATNDDG